MSPIKVIAFDYGGVIAERINEITVLHMAAEAGTEPRRFSRALWNHRAAYDAGTLDAAGYWHSVVREAGGSDCSEGLLQTLLTLDAIGWSRINSGMVRWMGTLKAAGIRLVIISNMARVTYEMVVKGSAWIHHFEHVVLSGDEGINKPDARIFVTAAERMKVHPEDMLFIDDIPANIEGARNAGLSGCTFVDSPSLAIALEQMHPEVPVTGLLAV